MKEKGLKVHSQNQQRSSLELSNVSFLGFTSIVSPREMESLSNGPTQKLSKSISRFSVYENQQKMKSDESNRLMEKFDQKIENQIRKSLHLPEDEGHFDRRRSKETSNLIKMIRQTSRLCHQTQEVLDKTIEQKQQNSVYSHQVSAAIPYLAQLSHQQNQISIKSSIEGQTEVVHIPSRSKEETLKINFIDFEEKQDSVHQDISPSFFSKLHYTETGIKPSFFYSTFKQEPLSEQNQESKQHPSIRIKMISPAHRNSIHSSQKEETSPPQKQLIFQRKSQINDSIIGSNSSLGYFPEKSLDNKRTNQIRPSSGASDTTLTVFKKVQSINLQEIQESAIKSPQKNFVALNRSKRSITKPSDSTNLSDFPTSIKSNSSLKENHRILKSQKILSRVAQQEKQISQRAERKQNNTTDLELQSHRLILKPPQLSNRKSNESKEKINNLSLKKQNSRLRSDHSQVSDSIKQEVTETPIYLQKINELVGAASEVCSSLIKDVYTLETASSLTSSMLNLKEKISHPKQSWIHDPKYIQTKERLMKQQKQEEVQKIHPYYELMGYTARSKMPRRSNEEIKEQRLVYFLRDKLSTPKSSNLSSSASILVTNRSNNTQQSPHSRNDKTQFKITSKKDSPEKRKQTSSINKQAETEDKLNCNVMHNQFENGFCRDATIKDLEPSETLNSLTKIQMLSSDTKKDKLISETKSSFTTQFNNLMKKRSSFESVSSLDKNQLLKQDSQFRYQEKSFEDSYFQEALKSQNGTQSKRNMNNQSIEIESSPQNSEITAVKQIMTRYGRLKTKESEIILNSMKKWRSKKKYETEKIEEIANKIERSREKFKFQSRSNQSIKTIIEDKYASKKDKMLRHLCLEDLQWSRLATESMELCDKMDKITAGAKTNVLNIKSNQRKNLIFH